MSSELSESQARLLEYLVNSVDHSVDSVIEVSSTENGEERIIEQTLEDCDTLPFYSNSKDAAALHVACAIHFVKLKDLGRFWLLLNFCTRRLRDWESKSYETKLTRSLWNGFAVVGLYFQYRLSAAEHDCNFELAIHELSSDSPGLVDEWLSACTQFLLQANYGEPSRFTFYENLLDVYVCALSLQQFSEYEHNWISKRLQGLPEATLQALFERLVKNVCALTPVVSRNSSVDSPSVLVGAFQYLMRRASSTLAEEELQAAIPDSMPPISSRSLDLLCILLCESTTGAVNPFRRHLSVMTANFPRVYELTLHYLALNTSFLIFFELLLAENADFANYVYTRSDSEALLQSLLQLLHRQVEASIDSGSQTLQLATIALLLLSSDDDYCQRMWSRDMGGMPPWFKHKLLLKKLSYGALALLVLQQAIMRNLGHLKSEGLHVSLLACFANFSQRSDDLPIAVAQRIVSFVEFVDKRLKKQQAESDAVGQSPTQTLNRDSGFVRMALQDLLFVLLESLDAIILFRLHKNVNLVYAMYHHQQTFRQIQGNINANHDRIISNIIVTIDYFQKALYSAKLFTPENQSPLLEEIVGVLSKALWRWSPPQLDSHPLIHYSFQLNPLLDYKFFLPIIFAKLVS